MKICRTKDWGYIRVAFICDTPMGWDIEGKEGNQYDETRDFVSYMQDLYSASNITVVAAGGIDENEINALVEKYFG